MTVAPTQSNIAAALRSFLVEILPTTGSDGRPLDAIAAQQNRIPTPRGSTYVVMTPLRFAQLATNTDSYTDAVFTGSIGGSTMTISAVNSAFDGEIAVGSIIFGTGVAAGTVVTELGTGTGGLGTYEVSPVQNISSRTLSAGTTQVVQEQQWTFQLDFHGSPLETEADISGDLATTVSTLFRDDFAVQQFANQSPNYGVSPLFADDPRQMPFFNDQQQVENRWVLEALLQANVVVSVPQQFADSVEVEVISVDEAYPP